MFIYIYISGRAERGKHIDNQINGGNIIVGCSFGPHDRYIELSGIHKYTHIYIYYVYIVYMYYIYILYTCMHCGNIIVGRSFGPDDGYIELSGF
jgi:hypothetical protein